MEQLAPFTLPAQWGVVLQSFLRPPHFSFPKLGAAGLGKEASMPQGGPPSQACLLRHNQHPLFASSSHSNYT